MLLLVAFTLLQASNETESTWERSYARIVSTNCLRCHNGSRAKAGLDLSSRVGLLTGGDRGAAIVVGQPTESLLIRRVMDGSMPPIGDGDQLPEADVAALREWIQSGAAWPTETPRLIEAPRHSANGTIAVVCWEEELSGRKARVQRITSRLRGDAQPVAAPAFDASHQRRATCRRATRAFWP